MSVNAHSRNDRGRRGVGGFTLIEVLVVVAIIALLISILLPSLRRARDESKRVVCQSNFRQMGFGIEYFVNDHKGFYPESERWLSWTPWYWGPKDPTEFTAPRPNPTTGRKESWLLRYLKVPEVYLCPMDTGERLWINAPNEWSSMPPGHTSYSMNGCLQELVSGRYESKNLPPPLASSYGSADPLANVWFKANILVDNAARQMIMMEESELAPFNDGHVDWEGYWRTGFKEQVDKLTARHHGKGQLLAFDGHVEQITSEKDFNAGTVRASQKSGRWYGALYPDRGYYRIRTRPFKQPSDKYHGSIDG